MRIPNCGGQRALIVFTAFLLVLILGVIQSDQLAAIAKDSQSALSDQQEQEDGDTDKAGKDKKEEESEGKKADKERQQQIKRALKIASAALRSGDEKKVVEGLAPISRYMNSTKAIELTLKAGEFYRLDPVASLVLNLLARIDTAEGVEYLVKQLKKTRSTERKILLIESFEVISHPATTKPLLDLLRKSKSPQIRLEVIRTLRAKPSKETVEALLSVFEEISMVQDTLSTELRITMHSMTGEDFIRIEDWTKWWSGKKAYWTPRKADIRGSLTKVHRKRKGIELPTIFGQEMASKKICIIVDTSGSMEKVDKRQKREEGSTKDKTRMERAKAELQRAVSALKSDVSFNLISFSTDVSAWQKKLVRATSSNKRKCLKFISSLQPSGFTNTMSAFQQALRIKDVDTIIFISDGSPTDMAGSADPAEIDELLKEVRKDNRFRKIRIHTYGFRGANVPFMIKLARNNYGIYTPIR